MLSRFLQVSWNRQNCVLDNVWINTCMFLNIIKPLLYRYGIKFAYIYCRLQAMPHHALTSVNNLIWFWMKMFIYKYRLQLSHVEYSSKVQVSQTSNVHGKIISCINDANILTLLVCMKIPIKFKINLGLYIVYN